MIQSLPFPDGTNIYHVHYLRDAFWGVSAIHLRKRQTSSLPSRSTHVVRMTNNQGRIINFTGHKCLGLPCKIHFLYWKIIGKFLGPHILLVIKSVVKSGAWKPVLVVHSGREGVWGPAILSGRRWIALWHILDTYTYPPGNFNKWIRTVPVSPSDLTDQNQLPWALSTLWLLLGRQLV